MWICCVNCSVCVSYLQYLSVCTCITYCRIWHIWCCYAYSYMHCRAYKGILFFAGCQKRTSLRANCKNGCASRSGLAALRLLGAAGMVWMFGRARTCLCIGDLLVHNYTWIIAPIANVAWFHTTICKFFLYTCKCVWFPWWILQNLLCRNFLQFLLPPNRGCAFVSACCSGYESHNDSFQFRIWAASPLVTPVWVTMWNVVSDFSQSLAGSPSVSTSSSSSKKPRSLELLRQMLGAAAVFFLLLRCVDLCKCLRVRILAYLHI